VWYYRRRDSSTDYKEMVIMTGHFEKGIWIEDPKLPFEPLVVKVKVEVDDSQMKALQVLFTKIQSTSARIKRNLSVLRGKNGKETS
jgi:hypothetical protein